MPRLTTALDEGNARHALAWMHAGVPCVLKLCAVACLTPPRRALLEPSP